MRARKDVSKVLSIRFRSPLPCAAGRFAVALVLAGFVSGCAGAGTVRERTAADWYEQGRRQLERKHYTEAVESFTEAGKLYRNAALDAQIQIAMADTYFADEEYDAAVESYGEFLRLHPRNPRSDWAQFRVGMSYFKQMRGRDRSQEATANAVEAFELLVDNFPRSELVGEAREHIVTCRRRLAEHELYVGRYYLRTKGYASAILRFETVLSEYRDVGYGEDALYFLALCYRGIDDREKARAARDELMKDYPESRYLGELGKDEG